MGHSYTQLFILCILYIIITVLERHDPRKSREDSSRDRGACRLTFFSLSLSPDGLCHSLSLKHMRSSKPNNLEAACVCGIFFYLRYYAVEYPHHTVAIMIPVHQKLD